MFGCRALCGCGVLARDSCSGTPHQMDRAVLPKIREWPCWAELPGSPEHEQCWSCQEGAENLPDLSWDEEREPAWGSANRELLGTAEQKDLSCNSTVGRESFCLFDCVSSRSDRVFSTLKTPLFPFVFPQNSCSVSGLLECFCARSGKGSRPVLQWVHTTCQNTSPAPPVNFNLL